MAGDDAFDIPAHPERRFTATGDLEYQGGVRFRLTPEGSLEGRAALVEAVLADGPYRFGDFLELPMPVYLVRDEGTGDVFRVSVRDGAVRLHVLPTTGEAGLCAFYERLCAASGTDWDVTRRRE